MPDLASDVLNTNYIQRTKAPVIHVCTRYLADDDWRFVVVLQHDDDVQLPRETPDQPAGSEAH